MVGRRKVREVGGLGATDGLPAAVPSGSSGAADVTDAIEHIMQLFTVLADQLEADMSERRALTEAIERLLPSSAAMPGGAPRVIGGTVFPTPPGPNAGGDISIVEEYDDPVVGVGSERARPHSPIDPRSLLDELTQAANGRGFGGDSIEALTRRATVAVFTGENGDANEALRLCRELLPDQVRVLGADHPATLTTRANVAAFTAECGDVGEAQRLSGELLADRARVLGADHPDTLTTRSDLAVFAGECGNTLEALRMFRELLPDRERVLGVDHPDTAATRDDMALFESAVSAE